MGMQRVVADPVAELAQTRDRGEAGGRGEVVEVAARHQQVRRLDAVRVLELGHRDGILE